ncbi:hypothetical protein [Methylobacterium dankookense]|uniref:Uncharacterized protein n=1 Tax=Methylobacterium dankookense TaxID=560405 RepID=A0A564G123_9HYPH|nr:hypothetical protein [Methylobacterium dankookense]GJD58258.1 hypothetical protein IFDJLNFL_4175 [Methylobacterium dankookense]VUF14173.1 hypothetical protein MTDSW087_03889 [Methylobacterium dankookense]
MASIFFRQSDGMPVTVDEAMQNGILKPGYRMHMRFGDGAPVQNDGAFLMADSPVRFMDNLPTADSTQIGSILADFGSNEVFRVRRAADSARMLSYTMFAAGSGATPGYFGDSQVAAGEASNWLRSLSEQAMKRVGEMYGASARGDTSINVGVDMAAVEAGRAAYIKTLDNAWKRPEPQVSSANQGEPQPVQDGRSAYDQMCDRLSNAWRR